MKDTHKFLNRLSKVIDLDVFYNIAFDRFGDVTMQGRLNSDNMKHVQKVMNKHQPEVEFGWLKWHRSFADYKLVIILM